MSDIASLVSRRLRRWEAGWVTDDEVATDVAAALEAAIVRGDPDVVGIVRDLARVEPLAPPLVDALATVARACTAGPPGWPLAAHSLGAAVREDLTARVAEKLMAGVASDLAVELAAALPADWHTAETLQLVAALDLDGDERRRLDRHLLSALLRLRGPEAYDRHVRPHLATRTPDAAALLVDAYLQPGLTASHRRAIVAHLAVRLDACSTRDLLRLVVRLSIEVADGPAMTVARHLATRSDLPPSAPPVLGLVLWLGGARSEGREVAQLEPAWHDTFGWPTQAARSVAAYLMAADAAPGTVLELCAVTLGTGSRDGSIASVGALVGRLAFMRMHAHLRRGDLVRAGREAAAVLEYHAYRGYMLHAQWPGQEFEAAFVDRLAVTPAELADARALARRAGEVADALNRRLVLSEGCVRLDVAG